LDAGSTVGAISAAFAPVWLITKAIIRMLLARIVSSTLSITWDIRGYAALASVVSDVCDLIGLINARLGTHHSTWVGIADLPQRLGYGLVLLVRHLRGDRGKRGHDTGEQSCHHPLPQAYAARGHRR
jgi:hypothetical protein